MFRPRLAPRSPLSCHPERREGSVFHIFLPPAPHSAPARKIRRRELLPLPPPTNHQSLSPLQSALTKKPWEGPLSHPWNFTTRYYAQTHQLDTVEPSHPQSFHAFPHTFRHTGGWACVLTFNLKFSFASESPRQLRVSSFAFRTHFFTAGYSLPHALHYERDACHDHP